MMSYQQNALLSEVRLDLGAILRGYFTRERALDLRDKVTDFLRDEAGSEMFRQRFRPMPKGHARVASVALRTVKED